MVCIFCLNPISTFYCSPEVSPTRINKRHFSLNISNPEFIYQLPLFLLQNLPSRNPAFPYVFVDEMFFHPGPQGKILDSIFTPPISLIQLVTKFYCFCLKKVFSDVALPFHLICYCLIQYSGPLRTCRGLVVAPGPRQNTKLHECSRILYKMT